LKKYIYLLPFLFWGCIDPYEVTIEDGPQLLTIEGMVTNGPGPHSVKLTRSDTYGSVFEGLIRPVAGATVIVRDEIGKVVFLKEDSENRGYYLTPSEFSAEVGRTYTLQIQLLEGKVYTSLPEKVAAVPEIQNISYQVERIPIQGEINDASGVQLIVDFEDPAGENNFYYWKKGESVHVLETRPDLYTELPPSRAPAPKDCCAVCFRTEQTSNASIFIANDDNFNGLNTRLAAGFIQDNGLRFVNTFRIDLEQYSISQEAYRFLRLAKQQSELSGSVFDPPPANIRGNIISLDNPDEVVLGYFMAAGETSKRIYISGADLDFRQPKGLITDDCRVVDGAVVNPPMDWNP
jgi:hypothetical protein